MTKETTVKRYRAKVNSYGFRGQHWQAGDVLEVSAEEAEVIPHHFEELGKGDDASTDPEVVKELEMQDKVDHARNIRARKTYDEVRPTPSGGPASAVDKKPEEKAKEAAERKAEEKENDERHEAERKLPKASASRSSMTQEERESAAESERQAKHKSR